MKHHIFYHSADLDGICSAAIVYDVFRADHNLVLQPINYGQAFPWESVSSDDAVTMVDFSLDPADMLKLRKACVNLVWIDHHVSAIERCDPSINGLRAVGEAACELCWRFYCSHEPDIPPVVRLVGRWDVHDLAHTGIYEVQFGLRALDMAPDDPRWRELVLSPDVPNLLIQQGAAVLAYTRQTDRRTVSAGAFLTELDGIRLLACNAGGGSDVFAGAPKAMLEQAQALCLFRYFGKSGMWAYTLFQIEGRTADVLAVAKARGGGGHAGACGFQSTEQVLKLPTRNTCSGRSE